MKEIEEKIQKHVEKILKKKKISYTDYLILKEEIERKERKEKS